MKLMKIITLLLVMSASVAYAQIDSKQTFIANLGDKTLEFLCDGDAGSPRVLVKRLGSTNNHYLLTYQLDDTDDCGQAKWLLEKLSSGNSSALVMLNPGRLGLNVQFTTFLIRGDTVSLAGHILVRADRISDTDYRSYSADADSNWERIDSLVGDKFATVRELRLMRAGSICIDKLGAVVWQEPCTAKRIFARRKKPICVEYRNQQGKVVPLNACASLVDQ